MQFHPCTGLSTLSKVGGYFEKVGVERGDSKQLDILNGRRLK
jgi:hypothetical protein